MEQPSPPTVSLGIRVTPSKIFYAVVTREGDSFRVIAKETIKRPKAFDEPQSLRHFRQAVFDLIRDFKANMGAVKLIEGNSQTKDVFRLNVEGVVQEAFASATLTQFFFGAIPKLGGALGISDKKAVKRIIDTGKEFDALDLTEFATEHRECCLAAIAAIRDHGH